MNEYELWLDESGDFEMESQTEKGRNPSLAGGILIPKGSLTDSRIRYLADPDHKGEFHAVEMTYKTARRIVPAALEEVCRAGGHLVYFENSERIDYHTNRDLYLRVLSSGLAQLVRLLSIEGPFRLTIIVALRLVPDKETDELLPITPEEYRKELKSYITHEFDDINFTLDPSCRIAMTVLSARQEARLALADYACNARLSLQADKYAPVRNRLLPLFESRYHFTVTALTSEAFIRSRLSACDVSAALLEFYTARGKMRRDMMIQEIMTKLSSLPYRLQRLQIRKFSSELRNYVAQETDFERSESLLNSVINTFFASLSDCGITAQADESLFWIYLSLSDMYLREGDIIRAGPVMEQMRRLIRSMNYRVENLAHLYFYRDKRALYEINCMDYETAVGTMDRTIKTMEDLISILGADNLILDYFGSEKELVSEYLGDAYCMKIYAELFCQRTDPQLYERSLRSDTDRALSMYQFPGELERNQQYRSKAENEAGNCLQALEWLLKTQNLSVENGIAPACVQYLTAARNEDRLSRCYYAMYYVEIMENAQRLGQTDLSKAMKSALDEEKQTVSDLLLPEKAFSIPSDAGREHVIFKDLFSDDSPRKYHPLEIVLWKYGTFLKRNGSHNAADQTWESALDVCDKNPYYTVLKLVAVAIQLERLYFRLAEGADKKRLLRDVIRRCTAIEKIEGLPSHMAHYSRSVLEAVSRSGETLSAKEVLQLSRKIAF